MKNILIFICLVVAGITSKAYFHPPYRERAYPPITDTLQWLKANIEQRNSFFVGKQLSVLLDTLSAYGLHDAIKEYTAPINSDDDSSWATPTTTVYTDHFTLYFGEIFGGGLKEQQHEASFWNHFHNNSIPDTVNTHICYIKLTFTQKIGLPTSTINDMRIGTLFISVEGICRPYVVQSVTVGEY